MLKIVIQISKIIQILLKQDKDLIEFMNLKFDEYKKFMNEEKIDKSIKCVFELLSETNAYIDTEAPWNLKKQIKIE